MKKNNLPTQPSPGFGGLRPQGGALSEEQRARSEAAEMLAGRLENSFSAIIDIINRFCAPGEIEELRRLYETADQKLRELLLSGILAASKTPAGREIIQADLSRQADCRFRVWLQTP